MIPTSIVIGLFAFIVIYVVGLLLSVYLLIGSIRKKDISSSITTLVILILYITFCFALM